MKASLIDDIALNLGLPPMGLEDYPRDSDHGLIATRLEAYNLEAQKRGWWFNTSVEKMEPTGLGGTIVLSPRVLAVRPLRHQVYNPGPIRLPPFDINDLTSNMVGSGPDAGDPFEQEFLAEVVRFLPWDASGIPVEFTRYLVERTSNALANFFGVPQRNEEEGRAWFELQRENADKSETLNTIDDNPYNYLTTRRR